MALNQGKPFMYVFLQLHRRQPLLAVRRGPAQVSARIAVRRRVLEHVQVTERVVDVPNNIILMEEV
jgi:hypothetical protein